MLRFSSLLFLLLFFCFYHLVRAQLPVCEPSSIWEKHPEQDWEKIAPTLQLIRQNKVTQLADKVVYPLKRVNPLPDIKNKAEFIRLYPILFDDELKQRVADYHENGLGEVHNAISFEPYYGDIWFDHQGNILQINYSSLAEQARKEKITQAIKKQMYPGTGEWKRNLLVWQSKTATVRVDEVDDGIRYIAWKRGKTIADKPDLILYNGTIEAHGSQGGMGYTFRNGEWTYLLDDTRLAKSWKEMGTHLILFKNDKKIAAYRTTVIK